MTGTITRRFSVTTQTNPDGLSLRLGTAVEWESANVTLELASLPVGNGWSGGFVLRPDEGNAAPTFAGRRLDLVAAKPSAAATGKTRWIKLGTATETTTHTIIVSCDTLPVGNWWDGKLRLFVHKEDGHPSRAASRPVIPGHR